MDVQPITVPQSLAYVLNAAADKSNVDFDYLVKTAMRESSLKPDAKAPSSSAVGLFQFLDSTWLQVMKEEGPRLGYQTYADAISKNSSGDYVVKDKKLRGEILKLREDPQVAADMAAAFTESNGQYLQSKFGRMPSPGELYIAHFLGPQGAEKLFNAGLADADQIAAKLFPSQARANRQIFYDGNHARTIREVYKALVAKHNVLVAAPMPDADPAFVAQQLASGQPAAAGTDSNPIVTPADMSFTSLFATQSGPPKVTPLIGTEAAAPLIAARSVVPSENAAPPVVAPRASDAAIAFTSPSRAPGPNPSTAAETPLQAIAAATGTPSSLATSPLPAPDPLRAPDQAISQPTVDGDLPAAAPLALIADSAAPDVAVPDAAAAIPPEPAAPQPRVEMTPGTKPNSAFFTQLYWSADDRLTTP
jgi:hypothetical protein